MKICILLYEHDLPDLRIESEARRLARGEHEIVIVCERRNDPDYQMDIENISVVRLKLEIRFLRAVNRIIYLLFLFDCFWFLTLARLHRQHRFDAFHISDLPLARTAQILAKLCNRRVVLDLHENYPVVLQAFWPWSMDWRMRFKKRILFSLSRWKRYEQSALSGADETIVVVEEAKQRIASLGIPEKQITIVGNTLKDSFMSFPQQDPQLEKRYSGKLLLSYIGSVNLSVALDKVIKAMPKIISAVPNAHLLILGEGSQIPELHQMITMFSLEQYVSFESWQPLSHIPSYMAVSSVGLLPFKPDEHHQSTVSHKLFQYMYMRCPVMASECKALIRIIADARCGRVVKGSMEISSIFAKDVITLLKDENLRYDMGCRGRRAVLANYRWPEDGDRLAELYQRLEASQTTKKLFQKVYD